MKELLYLFLLTSHFLFSYSKIIIPSSLSDTTAFVLFIQTGFNAHTTRIIRTISITIGKEKSLNEETKKEPEKKERERMTFSFKKLERERERQKFLREMVENT